jgi:hypothetical protein
MESLCPSVQNSGEAVRDQLTLGGILRAFLPVAPSAQLGRPQAAGALAACCLWYTGVGRHCSIVHTASTDTGRRAPAVTVIVRAAWPPKAGNGSKSRHGVSYRAHSTAYGVEAYELVKAEGKNRHFICRIRLSLSLQGVRTRNGIYRDYERRAQAEATLNPGREQRELTRKKVSAATPDPSDALIHSLSAHNVQYDSKQGYDDGHQVWYFKVQDPHSAKGFSVFVPVGSSEKIVRDSLKFVDKENRRTSCSGIGKDLFDLLAALPDPALFDVRGRAPDEGHALGWLPSPNIQ